MINRSERAAMPTSSEASRDARDFTRRVLGSTAVEPRIKPFFVPSLRLGTGRLH
jgi:hypothetical protein